MKIDIKYDFFKLVDVLVIQWFIILALSGVEIKVNESYGGREQNFRYNCSSAADFRDLSTHDFSRSAVKYSVGRTTGVKGTKPAPNRVRIGFVKLMSLSCA